MVAMRKGPGPCLALMKRKNATPKKRKIAMMTEGCCKMSQNVSSVYTSHSPLLQHIVLTRCLWSLRSKRCLNVQGWPTKCLDNSNCTSVRERSRKKERHTYPQAIVTNKSRKNSRSRLATNGSLGGERKAAGAKSGKVPWMNEPQTYR